MCPKVFHCQNSCPFQEILAPTFTCLGIVDQTCFLISLKSSWMTWGQKICRPLVPSTSWPVNNVCSHHRPQTKGLYPNDPIPNTLNYQLCNGNITSPTTPINSSASSLHPVCHHHYPSAKSSTQLLSPLLGTIGKQTKVHMRGCVALQQKFW